MADRIATYRDFWPYYLGQHSTPVCRAWHYLGATFGIAGVVLLIVTGNWWYLALALVAGYGPAWIGHFFFERNRPATFQYPMWSLLGDFPHVRPVPLGPIGDRTREGDGGSGGTGARAQRLRKGAHEGREDGEVTWTIVASVTCAGIG